MSGRCSGETPSGTPPRAADTRPTLIAMACRDGVIWTADAPVDEQLFWQGVVNE